jgi:hypothetical protein
MYYAYVLCSIFYVFLRENPVVYFTFLSILPSMQIVPLTTSELRITIDTTLLDRGDISTSEIYVSSDVRLHYVFV